MRHFEPNEKWEPYHVIMGQKVSVNSLKQPFDISDELAMCGCSNNISMKLCLAARLATLAINKMLAQEA